MSYESTTGFELITSSFVQCDIGLKLTNDNGIVLKTGIIILQIFTVLLLLTARHDYEQDLLLDVQYCKVVQ